MIESSVRNEQSESTVRKCFVNFYQSQVLSRGWRIDSLDQWSELTLKNMFNHLAPEFLNRENWEFNLFSVFHIILPQQRKFREVIFPILLKNFQDYFYEELLVQVLEELSAYAKAKGPNRFEVLGCFLERVVNKKMKLIPLFSKRVSRLLQILLSDSECPEDQKSVTLSFITEILS